MLPLKSLLKNHCILNIQQLFFSSIPLFYVEVMTSLFHNIQEGGSSGSQLFGIIPKKDVRCGFIMFIFALYTEIFKSEQFQMGLQLLLFIPKHSNFQDWTISHEASIFICAKNLPNLRRKILSKVSCEGLVGKSI